VTLRDAIARANAALDWIEQRDGPLKPDGYARVEATVAEVRAWGQAMSDDDERISEIRARHIEVDGMAAANECCYCYDVWPCDTAYLLERVDALAAERDAAVARAERAESERDVYRDALTLIARGVWTARNSVESIVWGAREALKKGAALAASSAEPSTVTTRTITIRCHCGRGVTIGPDPWCEGCVQSAATCDCVPATQGRGDA